MDRTCAVDGCDRTARDHTLCPAHAWRLTKYGDPLAGPPFRKPRGAPHPDCAIDGCDKPGKFRTWHEWSDRRWCESHRRRWKLYGDPEGTPPPKVSTPAQLAALAAGRGVPRPRLSAEQRAENARRSSREWARRWRAENPDEARRVRREQMRTYGPEYRQRWNHHNRLRRLAIAPPDDLAHEYALILRGDPCSYCGRPVEHIDHIEPIARGGDGQWTNLTGACAGCNWQKNARPLLIFLLDRLPA